MIPPRSTLGSRLAALPADRSVAAALVVSGLVAAGLAMTTDTRSHLVWGWLAALVYVAAGLRCALGRDPAAALRLAGWGGAVLPMAVLVVAGIGQPEVGVVQRSAQSLLETGSPYLDQVHQLTDVNPYLPLMSVFGLPAQVLPGTWLADPRPWFLLALVGCLWAAGRLTGRGQVGRRPAGTLGALLASPSTRMSAVLACPLVALHAAVGGHDLPVVGLAVLGLTCAATGRPLVAGLALGAAASLHALVWPVLPVALVLVATRWGLRTAVRTGLVTVGVLLVVTLPFVLGAGGSGAVAQLAGFPLGAGTLVSPADAPFPGVLLAEGGPGARLVGLGLLLGAVLALASAVLVRRPRTLPDAAALAALAVTVAVLLLPASRTGYLLLPAALLLWAGGSGRPAEVPAPTGVDVPATGSAPVPA